MADSSVVFVIDDDDSVRESLSFLLDCAGMCVRAFSSAQAFLDIEPKPHDGCIVSDIRMAGMDGLELQLKLPAHNIHLPIIFITGHGDVPIAVEALKNGASDFLEKPFEDERLLAAIRKAMTVTRARHERAAETVGILARLEQLTPREREVFGELVAGHPNKVVGYHLGMSPRTVEVHRARIMDKMAARNISELVRMGLALK